MTIKFFKQCCYADNNGVWIQCDFHERYAEFSAEMPGWQERENEHDMRESGEWITERDIEDSNEYLGIIAIADWDLYFAMESTFSDINERENY